MVSISRARKDADHNPINELGRNSDKNRKILKEGMDKPQQSPEHLDEGEKSYHTETQETTGKFQIPLRKKLYFGGK